MSFTRFEIASNGQSFYYDNTTHGLLSSAGSYINAEWTQPDDWEEWKDRFGKTSVVKNPETIKITLGHGCNYSCGYCMQKDIGNPNERPSNGLTPMLIKKIERHLDLRETSRIELWGGETLLYWKDMVEIMTAFDRPGVTWYIPTNGTPLQHKHIDFLQRLQGDIAFGISHDGPAHESTRGPEFLHKKVEVLRRIQDEAFPKIQFSLNPVISITNYDLFAIDKFFKTFFDDNNLKPVTLSYELGRVYDETMAKNSTHHVISGAHIDRYREVLTNYLDAHIDQLKTHGATKSGPMLANSLFHTGMGVLPHVRTLASRKIPSLRTNCGVDDSRLISMDMMGNVRTCQNTDEKFIGGSLMDIKGIKIQRVDLNRDDHCGSCHVRRLCKSSCPLDLGTATFQTNCNVEKAHYSAIQLASFKVLFNSNVIRHETVATL